MFSGFKERLTKEIKVLAPQNMKEYVKVISVSERKHSAWLGGSIFSSILKSQWITKDEYNEKGSSVVLKNYF